MNMIIACKQNHTCKQQKRVAVVGFFRPNDPCTVAVSYNVLVIRVYALALHFNCVLRLVQACEHLGRWANRNSQSAQGQQATNDKCNFYVNFVLPPGFQYTVRTARAISTKRTCKTGSFFIVHE